MFLEIVMAALVSGSACAAAGFILANLRSSFLGITMSHAAMAGAVFAKLLGLPMFPSAFGVALAGAFAIGPLADRARIDTNLAMGIVFSLSMGLAFMVIGLASGSKADLLGLIWGSILLIPTRDLILMTVLALLLFLFILLMEKEIKAVIFSRTIASAAGLPERFITYALLIACGAVITAFLETVGGLLLFALLANPVAAAQRLFRTYRATLLGSAGLGAASALGGLGLSLGFGLPAGASIVLVSGLIFILSLFVRKA
jgi:manganese/iron transport system permease protein